MCICPQCPFYYSRISIPVTDPSALSTKANEFFLGFMQNDQIAIDPDFPPSVALFITTDEPGDVEVTVTSDYTQPPFSETRTTAYGRHEIIRFVITTPAEDVRVSNIAERNKGIRVKAEGDKRITVYAFNHEGSSSDAFQVYPCHEYAVTGGRPYVYMIFGAEGALRNQEVLDRRSQFLLVGCSKVGTSVRVFPSNTASAVSVDDPNVMRGTFKGISIGDGFDTYLINAPNRIDLTGSVVRSNRPLAVFTGHQCSQVPFGVTACDHLVEQVPPHIAWGRLFFTVPVTRRSSGEHYRIGAITSNTMVTVTCVQASSSTPTNVLTTTIAGGNPSSDLNVRNWANFSTVASTDPQFCCIESSEPIIVLQYSLGHTVNVPVNGLEDTTGDPFMNTVPPVHQYLNNFTVSTSKGVPGGQVFDGGIGVAVSAEFFDNSASARENIVVNSTAVAPQDGGWKPIYCSSGAVCGYGGRQEVEKGSFNVLHKNPRAGLYVAVTGTGTEISFGYTSGFELENIGRKFSVRNCGG